MAWILLWLHFLKFIPFSIWLSNLYLGGNALETGKDVVDSLLPCEPIVGHYNCVVVTKQQVFVKLYNISRSNCSPLPIYS